MVLSRKTNSVIHGELDVTASVKQAMSNVESLRVHVSAELVLVGVSSHLVTFVPVLQESVEHIQLAIAVLLLLVLILSVELIRRVIVVHRLLVLLECVVFPLPAIPVVN